MSGSAFERYAPFIQEYIYRKQWTDLREVQVEACEAILDTGRHVIIASGTASGKTEAAFFPILTQLEQRPPASIGALYIGPLKALINDQFERLNELLADRDIPVWPWHGDVSQSLKRKALAAARGILQITPESLEALLMRHPGDAVRLFSDLRFIVIDEIHALMGADRGLQILCLIARLEQLAGCNPRRIGLSATLNDYRPAMDFLASGSRRGAVAVGIRSHRRTISLCVESFAVPEPGEGANQAMRDYYDFLYNHCHTKKCLIFANSRRSAEEAVANMKRIARERGERDVFHVHHGSVSAALRQEAEHALRDGEGPAVAAATLTLELGIDIGDLDSTIQLGAPFSCSSFVQRMGRSGRRSGRSQMMFVNLHDASHQAPLGALPWDLLRSIAIIQLYLEERWVEPFVGKRKPFSLLAHQTLSALMTFGELSPAALAEKILLLPAFRGAVSADEYRELLRYMLDQDYLQRMEGGGLIPGLKGEQIANHYSFYAVFQEEETFHVVSAEGEIGTLTSCPAVGETFVLAGRAWRALSVDVERRQVFVSRANETKIPSWAGAGGEIHERIVQRMRQVLAEDAAYPYLQPGARALLDQARACARESGLLDRAVIPCEGGAFLLCPWTGSRELRTLERLLNHGLKDRLGILRAVRTGHILTVASELGLDACMRRFRELELDPDDPGMVLPADQSPRIDKYDAMVPDALLRRAYLYNHADVPAARAILRRIGGEWAAK